MMKTFTDNAGRTWTIAINVDAIKRVRGLLDVDLLEIVEGKLIERLIRDPVLLCDVVYAVCKPEADARNITDEDFGRAMAGDAIEMATKALLEELVGFFPNERDRKNLNRILRMTTELMDRMRDVIQSRLDGEKTEQLIDLVYKRVVELARERVDPEKAKEVIQHEIEQALATAGTSSGDAPESSASTPDGSPSLN